MKLRAHEIVSYYLRTRTVISYNKKNNKKFNVITIMINPKKNVNIFHYKLIL